MKRIAALSLLCLTGCAQVYPMGPQQSMIRCGDGPLVFHMCAEKANEACPAGFDVLSHTDNGMMTTMTIKCR